MPLCNCRVCTPVDIDKYAEWSEKTWVSGKLDRLALAGLGLAGEAGEVVEIIKKQLRDETLQCYSVGPIKKELGDVLYYWVRICVMYGLKPSEVMEANIAKLEDRLHRGKISGSGDNR